MRPTSECVQMNAIYDCLEKLNPSPDQIRELYNEALLIATAADDPEERRQAALFCYQLRIHVQNRLQDPAPRPPGNSDSTNPVSTE